MSEDEGKKVTAYRLEYASSGRSKCKGPKPCAGTLINKGDLRLGTPVTFAGRTSMAWRHWGCVTPKIINNFKSSFTSIDELDGYEELKKADKERIQEAWEAGHVADEDIPDTARKGAVDEEDEEDKKPDAKKKSKAKKKGDDNEAEAEAPKKKAPKKASTAKEKAPPKKKTVRKKKASESEGENFEDEIDKVSGEEDEPEEEEAEGGKKRKRPVSKKEVEAKKPKKPRAKKSKKKTESEDEDDDN